jgi:hypothetical protein
MPDTQTLLSIAPAVSAIIALFAFIFAVWNTLRRESNRRDWERLQALAQILHQGPDAGIWAQKLAARELAGLKTKKSEALLLAQEALIYWEANGPSHPELQSELRESIYRLSNKRRRF